MFLLIGETQNVGKKLLRIVLDYWQWNLVTIGCHKNLKIEILLKLIKNTSLVIAGVFFFIQAQTRTEFIVSDKFSLGFKSVSKAIGCVSCHL